MRLSLVPSPPYSPLAPTFLPSYAEAWNAIFCSAGSSGAKSVPFLDSTVNPMALCRRVPVSKLNGEVSLISQYHLLKFRVIINEGIRRSFCSYHNPLITHRPIAHRDYCQRGTIRRILGREV